MAERQIPDKERRVVSTMIRVKAENVLDLACPFVRRELMLFAESLSARDGAWERILRSLEPWEGELSAGGLLVELFAMRAPKEVKAVRAIHRVLASDEFLPPSLNRLKAARRQTGMLVNREIGFEFGYVIMWAVRDFSVLRGWSNPAIPF